jgi:hypothetical protein
VEKAMIYFTITAPEGSFVSSPIGRVPGGYRSQVDWAGPGQPRITFKGKSGPDPANLTEIEGFVVAGSDWVLMRDDGVGTFSAKITFKSTKPYRGVDAQGKAVPGDHVFDAQLTGRVNVKGLGWTSKIGKPEDLLKLKGALKVALPIQFETSGPAPDGASDEIKSAALHWETFAELAKHQFAAIGTIQVENGTISTMDLKVVQVTDLEANAQKLDSDVKSLTAKVLTLSSEVQTLAKRNENLRTSRRTENIYASEVTALAEELLSKMKPSDKESGTRKLAAAIDKRGCDPRKDPPHEQTTSAEKVPVTS